MIHLYYRGIDQFGKPRPGYEELRHAHQCWCVAEHRDIVKLAHAYYEYSWREVENPTPPEHATGAPVMH